MKPIHRSCDPISHTHAFPYLSYVSINVLWYFNFQSIGTKNKNKTKKNEETAYYKTKHFYFTLSEFEILR